jgi:hypothetical protein
MVYTRLKLQASQGEGRRRADACTWWTSGFNLRRMSPHGIKRSQPKKPLANGGRQSLGTDWQADVTDSSLLGLLFPVPSVSRTHSRVKVPLHELKHHEEIQPRKCTEGSEDRQACPLALFFLRELSLNTDSVDNTTSFPVWYWCERTVSILHYYDWNRVSH